MSTVTGGRAPLRLDGLDPVLRAIAATAGPSRGTCLIARTGGVGRSEAAIDIVRPLAEPRHRSRVLPRLLRELMFELDRDFGDGTARLALLWGGLVTRAAAETAAGVPAGSLASALRRLGDTTATAMNARFGAPAESAARLRAVALAAGAPPPLAQALADALWSAGPDAAAELAICRRPGLALETGEGFVFEAEPVASSFAEVDLDPAYILVADAVIEDLGPLAELLEAFALRGRALAVVARSVRGSALQLLLRNQGKNGLRVAALRPATASQGAANVLEDLAVATGATLVAERDGTSMAHLRPAMLGRCARFSFARGRALLQAPAGDRAAVEARVAQLLAEAERSKFLALDRDRFESRARHLTGRWVRLSLGPEDAAGSGTTLARARRALASTRLAFRGVGPTTSAAIALCLDATSEGCAGDAERGARRALETGIAYLEGSMRPGGRPAWPPYSPGRAAPPFGEAAPADPIDLSADILRRAVSGAANAIEAGALVLD